MTFGPIFEGHIRLFAEKPCVPRVGARLRAKQNFCSRNSTIELLCGGVGRAELKNGAELEKNWNRAQTSPKSRCLVLKKEQVLDV
jgi:hypothetical protein